MCGILCVLGHCCCNSLSIKDALTISNTMKHRGPDATGILSLQNKYILCHERLSIVGTKNGNQPFEWIGYDNESHSINRKIHLSANGEIYNYKELYLDHLSESETQYKPSTLSDCEVILHLYRKYGVNFLSLLRGMYTFILLDTDIDKNETKIFFARDVLGIKPLFVGYDYYKKQCIYLSSELKAISKICHFVERVKPGHYCYAVINDNIINNKFTFKLTPFYFPLYDNKHYNYYNNDDLKAIKYKIRSLLIESVKLRMLRDSKNGIKIGAYLSGGLDSSLVTGIAAKFTDELYTFSIGLKYYDYEKNKWIIGDDVIAARKVVKHLSKTCNIIHNEYLFDPYDVTKNDGEIIQNTIYAFESYDEIMLRSCIPNLLVAKLASDHNIKLILTGEGADEIFAGYLHLKYYKNGNNLQKTLVEMIHKLQTTMLQRQDGCSMYYGVEARVPFLDEKLIRYAMTINPKYKLHSFNNIEKYILRSAFDENQNEPLIPKEVLWREKCTFSLGVGIKLYQTLIEFCSKKISDLQMENAKNKFPINTPESKTQYYYRDTFENYFGSNCNNCVQLLVSKKEKVRQKFYTELMSKL